MPSDNDLEMLDGPSYRTIEYDDETSQFDPKGRWCPGSDCYQRTYKVRVPAELTEDEIDDWLDRNAGRVVYLD